MIPITGNPHGTITSAEVTPKGAASPAKYDNSAALKLVVQDASRAEMWLDSKQWGLYWRETDILYQSPRAFTGADNPNTSANVSRFTVAKHCNTLVPTIMSGIFYDSPPFVLRPRPGTHEKTTRNKTAVFGALFDEMDFKGESEMGIDSQVLNGTGIWKWGHYTENRKRKIYRRKRKPAEVNLPFSDKPTKVNTKESDEFELVELTEKRWRPFLEHRPLGTVLVAPGWRHANKIAKAPFVIDRMYLTFKDFQRLREQDGYKIPADEELITWFFPPAAETPLMPGGVEQQQQANVVHHAQGREETQSADPMLTALRVDERWDNDTVMTVVQDKQLIRNEQNKEGEIPFLSCNWWNIQNAGYGLGVGRLVGTDQRVEQGTMNAALNILGTAVNQTYVRSRGANVPAQNLRLRLGGIIDVDGEVDKAFKILDPPKVPPEIWTALQTAKAAGESASGADEPFMQGNLPQRGGSSAARTATGAGNIAGASATRIQGPVGRFVDNVFIPFLKKLDAMVNQYMPVKEIREILSQELGDEYVDEEFDVDNFFNASFRYEVLAGAHLAAKKAMAQALPLIIQIFENPHLLESLNAMGMTVDVKELFEMMMEMSEWKNTRDVIRPMTKDEKASYMAIKDPKNQVAGELTKIDAKHQATSAEIDQKSEAALASKLVTDSADKATNYVERVQMEHALESRQIEKPEAGQFHTTAQ